MDQKIFDALKQIAIIPQLKRIQHHHFTCCTLEQRLGPIVRNNDIIIVTGAFRGDESKGKQIDALCQFEEIQLVVRANSGQNAGHTIYLPNGIKFTTHGVPSGVFRRKKCLMNSEQVLDPWTLMNQEIARLAEHNIPYDNLYAGNFHIVAPYHKLYDLICSADNSSTLQGMSPVHMSKVDKKTLRLDDLFRPEKEQFDIIMNDMELFTQMRERKRLSYEDILKRCEEMNKDRERFPEHIIGFLRAELKIKYLIDLYKKTVSENPAFPKRTDSFELIQSTLDSGGKVLIEGSQSGLISSTYEKTYRDGTAADTTPAGLLASTGLPPGKYRTAVINVHKVPPSKVGRGVHVGGFAPQDYFSKQNKRTVKDLEGMCEDTQAIRAAYFSSIQENGILKPNKYTDKDGTEYLVGEAMAIAHAKELEEFGATTGKPRMLGIFDCVQLNETLKRQGSLLSISAMDRLDKWEKVGLVVAYVYHSPDGNASESNGRKYENSHIIKPGDTLPCAHVLEHCYPIIKVMDGWPGHSIAGEHEQDWEPHENAQAFCSEIETLTGAEILSIGKGKLPQDLIYLKRR
jgi:adenylosuccinate synthase